ncbi:hypothetical protein QBC46DRAFT_390973 [Diplogelasinospora grovesii]|uniref:Uncharacterized protein n=1 Tax=Diplogelasinospora grovesii TaxID=303347 RepID=A0AAN6N4J6_9PEZI|nr:hypothetical protein QBC46DRAFT_390973 [Diplogelasinospora grovesii]
MQYLNPEMPSPVSTPSPPTIPPLSRHPHIYTELAAEIRTTFTSGRDIQDCPSWPGPSTSALSLMRACTWRLHPSRPSGGICGRRARHTYPRGRRAWCICTYSVLHDPDDFPETLSRSTQRAGQVGVRGWRDGEEDGRAQVTFRLGDRSCAGKAVALWHFDFRLRRERLESLAREGREMTAAGRKGDRQQLCDILVANHDGPSLVLNPRGRVGGRNVNNPGNINPDVRVRAMTGG